MARPGQEPRVLPAISLGTSPFIGAGQFGERASQYYRQFYLQPENMSRLMVKAAEMGVNSVQLLATERIIQAFRRAQEMLSQGLCCHVVIGLNDWQRELREVIELQPRMAFIHASISDSQDLSLLATVCQEIGRYGLPVGCATHLPERTIPFLDQQDLGIEAYLVPVNPLGLFMGPDPSRVIQRIGETKKVVIAKKVLAAGRVSAEEGISYVAKIKKIKGIVVGITSEREAEETFSLAKRYYC